MGSTSSELALHFFMNLQLIFTDGEEGGAPNSGTCLSNLAAN